MMKKLILFSMAILVCLAPAMAEVTVQIVDPIAGQPVEPCIDQLVKAEVTATAGEQIQYVYLYYNGRTLRRLKAEPWEYTMKAIKKGVYVFQAKVELTDGTEIFSDEVKVKVGNVHGGEVLLSGGFDCGVLSPWTGQLNEGAIATFNVFNDGYFDDPTYLAIEIENGGSAEWHIQLNQTCPTDSGHFYTISFLADSEEPKTIVVGMQESQDPWANQIWQSVAIDGADLYTVEFEATRTDPTNALRFNVGGNSIPFFLDDVSVVDNSATSVKSYKYDMMNSLVAEYELFQAYPNPFNMNTTIRFRLSNAADVSLDIFNMNGQKVKTLLDESKSAGQHVIGWNGTDEFGGIVPSGVYLYKLHVNDGAHVTDLSRKVVLLK